MCKLAKLKCTGVYAELIECYILFFCKALLSLADGLQLKGNFATSNRRVYFENP